MFEELLFFYCLLIILIILIKHPRTLTVSTKPKCAVKILGLTYWQAVISLFTHSLKRGHLSKIVLTLYYNI